MVRKNHTPEENERRVKIRELLQMIGVRSSTGKGPARCGRMVAAAFGSRIRSGLSGYHPLPGTQ